MEIREIKSADNTALAQIVNIHLDTFKGFFLTFMGKGFLKQMYQAHVKHAGSRIIVAEENGKIIGFLAYSEQMSKLYKYMIKHQLIPFAWFSLGAFLRKPKIFFRLLRAFLRPGEARRSERYIELTSLGVAPEFKHRGVGTALIQAAKDATDFSVFEYISLRTDAIDNDIANKFYVKNGFSIVREYETPEKRKMYEYRYRGDMNS